MKKDLSGFNIRALPPTDAGADLACMARSNVVEFLQHLCMHPEWGSAKFNTRIVDCQREATKIRSSHLYNLYAEHAGATPGRTMDTARFGKALKLYGIVRDDGLPRVNGKQVYHYTMPVLADLEQALRKQQQWSRWQD